MTAIVAIAQDGKVYMGGDSAGSNYRAITNRKDEKVFIKGKFIFGCTSSFRMIQILKWSFTVPAQKKNMSDEEYMQTTFVNALRKCFKKYGFGKIAEGSDNRGGTFLVGYKGEIYEVENDFQVGMCHDNFNAVGIGDDTCIGSLFSTKHEPPRTRLQRALEAAEFRNIGVRAPYVIKCLEK